MGPSWISSPGVIGFGDCGSLFTYLQDKGAIAGKFSPVVEGTEKKGARGAN